MDQSFYDPFNTGALRQREGSDLLSPGARALVNATIRDEAKAARADPLDDEIKVLNERRTNLRYQRESLKSQLHSYIADTSPNGGADLFENDALTGKPLKNPDGSFVPRLGAEVDSLRSRAQQKTGLIAGALSPSKRQGDPTDDAVAAQQRLAQLEPLYRLKRQKFDRIQAEMNRLDAADKEHEARLGELGAAREARYTVSSQDVAGAVGSVNAERAMRGQAPVRPEDALPPPVPNRQRTLADFDTPAIRAQLAANRTPDYPPEVFSPVGADAARKPAGRSIAPEAIDARVSAQADKLGLPPSAARAVEVDELRKLGVSHIGGDSIEDFAAPPEAVGEAKLVATVNKLRTELNQIDAATGPDSQLAAPVKERMLRQRAITAKLLERKTTSPQYQAVGTFFPELKRGAANVMAGNAAIVGAISKPFAWVENKVASALDLKSYKGGFDKLGEFAVEANDFWNRAAGGVTSKAPQRIEDIGGAADFGRWFVGQIGQQVPVMADLVTTTLASGGTNLGARLAGGARKVLPTVVAPLFERAVAKGQIAGGILKKIGGSPEAWLAASKTEFGSIYSDMLEMGREEGDPHKYDSPTAAAVFGVIAGALEGLPVAAVLKKIGLQGDAYRGIMRKALTDPNLLKRMLASTAEQSALEAGTEFFQTWVEHAAQSWVNENKPLFTQENYMEALNAAAAGAVLGVPEGVTTGIKPHVAPETPGTQPTPVPPSPTPPAPSGANPPQPQPEGGGPRGQEVQRQAQGPVTAPAPAAQSAGDVAPTAPSPTSAPPEVTLDQQAEKSFEFTNRSGKTVVVTAPRESQALAKLPNDFGAVAGMKRVENPTARLQGEKLSKEWTAFAPDSGSIGIPRAEMPQIKAEHRGALTQFLKGRDIMSEDSEVLPTELKPTQAEFSPGKVQKAREFSGGDRAILVSSDNYVVDGHHQWMAKLTDAPDQYMRVIKIDAPIRDVLEQMKEFPSVAYAGGSAKPTSHEQTQTPVSQQPSVESTPAAPPLKPSLIPAATTSTPGGAKPDESAVRGSGGTSAGASPAPVPPSAKSPLVQRASDAFRRVLAVSPEGNSTWHQQAREQIENPERFHPVAEDENPKGLKIGDTVTVTPRRANESPYQGIVATVQKTSATAYQGGYQVKVLPMREGSYGGFHGIDSVEKTAPGSPATATPAPTPQPPANRPPTINRGANKPAKFIQAVAKAGGLKASDKATRFLQDFAPRLHKANARAFEQMEIHVLKQSEWDADSRTAASTPDSAAAYSPDTNTLFLNADKLKGNDGVDAVSAIVHEAGHFAEHFALGEALTQREWEKLTHTQRVAARKEYDGADMSADPVVLLKDRRSRAEWIAMQFARVVRGETDGMPKNVAERLKAFLEQVRELVRKWVGAKSLTTAELDSWILDKLGYAAREEQTREVGVNRNGQMVEEDANGVRSVVTGRFRATEAVQLTPTRQGVQTSVDVSDRVNTPYETAEERTTREKSNPPDAPSSEIPTPTPTITARQSTAKEINQGAHPWRAVASSDEGGYLAVAGSGTTELAARKDALREFELKTKERRWRKAPAATDARPAAKTAEAATKPDPKGAISDKLKKLGDELFGTPAVAGFNQKFDPAKIEVANKFVGLLVREHPAVRSRAALARFITDNFPKARPFSESVFRIMGGFADLDESGTFEEAYRNIDVEKPTARSYGQKVTDAADQIGAAINEGKTLTWRDLFAMTDRTFGGTQAAGAYSVKDAYDAMELAVNRWIASGDHFADGTLQGESHIFRVRQALSDIAAMLGKLPTQSKRTAEMDAMQQFSTPPTLGLIANWVANLRKTDVYEEPSAGTGGLLAFARAAGVKTIIANELSDRRAEILIDSKLADRVTMHNAEYLNALLEPEIKRGQIERPTVVVMNPPFSNGAESGKRKDSMVGARHVEDALKSLAPGGRLVAIVGEGMAFGKPTFTQWWKAIRAKYNVRANVGISGAEYGKYGTTFDNQILIIDNDGPTSAEPVQGKVDNFSALPTVLEGVRNGRPEIRTDAGRVEQTPAQPGGIDRPQESWNQPRGASAQSDAGARTSDRGTRPGERTGSAAGVAQPMGNRPSVAESRTSGAGESAGAGGTASGDSAGNGGADSERVGSGGEQSPTGLTVGRQEAQTGRPVAADDEAVFSEYTPSKAKVEGAIAHPTPLVESAAMAAVAPPDPIYTPNLPKEVVTEGKLSDAQLENVIYAGQAHTKRLPDGSRRGYFIGDGTGVGKGRQIAAIIFDNWRQGRTKAVWISKTGTLADDARRDLHDLGMKEEVLVPINKAAKAGSGRIALKDGVVFSTYTSLAKDHEGLSSDGKLRKKNAEKKTRIEQIVEWVGRDFDGVIAFDEAHMAGNAVAVKTNRGMKDPSNTGIAVVDLQKMLPKARVVYVSATGATEVSNLSYADREGIWGPRTPFPTKLDFFDKISAGGVSAMEIVARDLKSLGGYMARTLSFNGVKFESLQQSLTPDQTELYNQIADGWQLVFQNMDAAMAQTNASKNARARSAARSAFFGAQQRFFNQLLTAMEMPVVIRDVRATLEAGHSAVLQLVNTNEATQDREIARASTEEQTDLEDLDLSPKDILLQYVDKSFPTTLYKEVQDPNNPDRTMWVPVTDENGNPVQDPAAVARKDELLLKIQTLRVPENPLEMVLNEFGHDAVAEITGRGQRIVTKKRDDGSTGRVLESNRTEARRKVEAQEFQDGKRRILVFSGAGGTGFSYHASRKAKNQQLRVHYLVQAGWRADAALQGFGRTHRSDQAQPPLYKLVTTDIQGHKRFISTIARRLAQLGALTAGERQAAGQGLFSEKDNLESKYADDALTRFFYDLYGSKIDGLDFGELTKQMGFGHTTGSGETAVWKSSLSDPKTGELYRDKLPTIQQFLNRLLALRPAQQNRVFNEFFQRMETRIENAKADGSYDPGTQTYRAAELRKITDEVVYRHPDSTAETRLVDIEAVEPLKFTQFDDVPTIGSAPVERYVTNNQSGRVYALKEGPPRTDSDTGAVTPTFRRIGTHGSIEISPRDDFTDEKYTTLPNDAAARVAWEEEIAAAPKTHSRHEHFVVGAFLPIWDRIKIDSPKIYRFTTNNGETMLGALIPPKQVDGVRKRLGARKSEKSETQIIRSIIEDGQSYELANGWTMKRVRVSGEPRIEVSGMGYRDTIDFTKDIGGFSERIGFQTRFFLPTEGTKGSGAMGRLLEKSPIADKTFGETLGTPRVTKAQKLAELEAALNGDQMRRARANLSAGSDLDAAIKREVGKLGPKEMTLDEFYSLYSAHVTNLRQGAAQNPPLTREKFESGMTGGGVAPTRPADTWRYERGKYQPGHQVVLVPAHELVVSDAPDVIAPGYRPRPDEVAILKEGDIRPDGLVDFPKVFGVGGDLMGTPPVRGTPAQEAVLAKVNGTLEDKRTLRERMGDYLADLKDYVALELKQKLLDQFAAIKRLERATFGAGANLDASVSAYKAARLSKNLPSVMDFLMNHGQLEYRNGSFAMKQRGTGLMRIFKPLIDAGTLRLWEGYATAFRANRLLAEGKETNFGRTFDSATGTWSWNAADAQREINELLALGEQHPEFEQVRQQYVDFQKSVLDVAEAAGLVSAEQRATWEKSDYVPFYRITEALDGKGKGPRRRRGIADQRSGIRKLKGGAAPVAIMENIVRNIESLIDASFKNVAMQRVADLASGNNDMLVRIPYQAVPFKASVAEVLDVLEKAGVDTSGLTTEEAEEFVKFWRMRAPKGKDVVSVMVDGRPIYYRVKDAALLRSVLSMGPRAHAWWMNALMAPKQLLTHAVTLDPAFMAANTIRDSFSAWVIADTPIRPGIDSVTGFVKSLRNAPSKLAIMAAGGGSGHYNNLRDGAVRGYIRQLTPADRKTFLESIIDTPKKLARLYTDLGRATENANRIAIADSVRKRGGSDAEAAFQALDIMDFGLRGDSDLLNFFLDTVPFLNARIQGLYRLGRGLKENPARVATHGAIIVGASLALLAANWDDDRYWELPEWERDVYYHFWIDGQHIRIPKPFEVGQLFSTAPERLSEYVGKTGDGKLLGKRMLSMVGDTFAMNPLPQALKPLAERAMNLNTFTGRPIIARGDEFKRPEQQFNALTSETLREVADAMPDGAPAWIRSPKTLEQFVRGYFGSLGMYALTAADSLTRAATNAPEEPAVKPGDWWVMKRFAPSSDVRETKYVAQFYDLHKELAALVEQMHELQKQGDLEGARGVQADNADLLSFSTRVNSAYKTLQGLRQQEQRVYASSESSDRKREQLADLASRRNSVAAGTVLASPRRPRPLFNPFAH